MPNIGPLEIAVVLIIVLVIFGPKRLPELGRSMGKGMRDFKGALSGDDDDDDIDAKRRELHASETTPPASPSTPPAAEPVEGEVVTDNKS